MNVRYIQAIAKGVHTKLIKPIVAREGSLYSAVYRRCGACGDFPSLVHTCLQVSMHLPPTTGVLFSSLPMHFNFYLNPSSECRVSFFVCSIHSRNVSRMLLRILLHSVRHTPIAAAPGPAHVIFTLTGRGGRQTFCIPALN